MPRQYKDQTWRKSWIDSDWHSVSISPTAVLVTEVLPISYQGGSWGSTNRSGYDSSPLKSPQKHLETTAHRYEREKPKKIMVIALPSNPQRRIGRRPYLSEASPHITVVSI